MLRNQIIRAPAAVSAPTPDEIDIAAVATVLVTSEAAEHPVDHAFDAHRGPGGSRWVAGEPGEQVLILAFDAPQAIRRVVLEVEEWEVARTQELQLAFSADGRLLASASQDMQTTLPGKVDIESLPDGAAIMTGNGSTMTLWDRTVPRKPTVVRQVTKIVGVIWAVAFSLNGRTLAAGTGFKVVRLWDVATGHEKVPLRGHTDVVHGIAYSPDGTMLATASKDRTVKVWDAGSGEELATLEGHTNAVKCVAFSPDGRMIASGSWDNTARIWDVSGVKAPGVSRPR